MLKTLLSAAGVYRLYEKWLQYQLKGGYKPEHIAIILDGNRRWAMGQSINPWMGHSFGADKVEDRDRHRWEYDPASSEDYRDRKSRD